MFLLCITAGFLENNLSHLQEMLASFSFIIESIKSLIFSFVEGFGTLKKVFRGTFLGMRQIANF